MINTLLVLNIIVVILLIVIILFQKSEGGVLGMGGGGSKNGVLTSRSAGNLITKITYTLAAMFFVICILLATLVSRRQKEESFVSGMLKKSGQESVRQISTPDAKKIDEDAIKKEMEKEIKKPVVPVN